MAAKMTAVGPLCPSWDPYVDEIVDLLVLQNKTFPQVKDHMETKYRFMATESQYKRRFPNMKNLKAEDWIWIGQEIKRRDALGKVSEPCLWGRPLPVDRVTRELRRHGAAILALQTRGQQIENPDPDRISVRSPGPHNSSSGPTLASPEPTVAISASLAAPASAQATIAQLSSTSITANAQAPISTLGEIATSTPGGMLDQATLESEFLVSPDAPSLDLRQDPVRSFVDDVGGFSPESRAFGVDMDLDSDYHDIIHTVEPGGFLFGDGTAQIDFLAGTETFEFDFSWRASGRSPSATRSSRRAGRAMSRRVSSTNSNHVLNLTAFGGDTSSHLELDLPWFQLQTVLDSRVFLSPRSPNLSLRGSSSSAIILSADSRRGILGSLVGSSSDLLKPENVVKLTQKLQRTLPQRYDGEISGTVTRLLDPSSSGASGLTSLFSIAAYYASNCRLSTTALDTFVKWVVQERFISQFEQFLQLNTLTTRAFVAQIRLAALRVKNLAFLNALLQRGVKFDTCLEEVYLVKNSEFMELVLSQTAREVFQRQSAAGLFHRCLAENDFGLVQQLLDRGVPVDCLSKPMPRQKTALLQAVSRNNLTQVEFLLKAGANVNHSSFGGYPPSSLPTAVKNYNPCPELIRTLLKSGANTQCRVDEQDILAWTLSNRRAIYSIILRHSNPEEEKTVQPVTDSDILEAAKHGRQWLESYLEQHQQLGDKIQDAKNSALVKAVGIFHETAVLALLQSGSDAKDAKVLTSAFGNESPRLRRTRICKLLVQYGADVNVPGILKSAVALEDMEAMQYLVDCGLRIIDQGVEALVKAAEVGYLLGASFLLDVGTDVNSYGNRLTPLQAATDCDVSDPESQLDMVEFLISQKAEINALASFNGGRTVMQAALAGDFPSVMGSYLLECGADASAPPALVDGLTSLEALFNWHEDFSAIDAPFLECLLDRGATIDRPGGKPSSVLHRCISNKREFLPRLLDFEHGASINFMWCDKRAEESIWHSWEPRTPLQLAVQYKDRDIVETLIKHGADINSPAAAHLGRTALQNALSDDSPDIDFVTFLIGKGADIHAKPAVEGGITALQGAAIAGDLQIAQLLIGKGADVNARAAFKDGRYAIEGAAEHGRLDMVKLLLNAGAKGNAIRGTGFKYAIKLAGENGHEAIVDLLMEAQGQGS